jgi:uncharacterized membrane protein (UPF0127 family)
MKIFLSLLLTLFVFACDNAGGAASGNADQSKKLSVLRQDGSKVDFTVELALTPKDQERGLMNRTELADDAGMLFVFPGPEAEHPFWMKNTLIPLDMIFIRKDGTIHHIHENAVPNDLTSISSNGPVGAVLEVKGGTAKRLGIKAGDKVESVFFE